jgi:hypothetical protein
MDCGNASVRRYFSETGQPQVLYNRTRGVRCVSSPESSSVDPENVVGVNVYTDEHDTRVERDAAFVMECPSSPIDGCAVDVGTMAASCKVGAVRLNRS